MKNLFPHLAAGNLLSSKSLGATDLSTISIVGCVRLHHDVPCMIAHFFLALTSIPLPHVSQIIHLPTEEHLVASWLLTYLIMTKAAVKICTQVGWLVCFVNTFSTHLGSLKCCCRHHYLTAEPVLYL